MQAPVLHDGRGCSFSFFISQFKCLNKLKYRAQTKKPSHRCSFRTRAWPPEELIPGIGPAHDALSKTDGIGGAILTKRRTLCYI